MKVAAVLCSVVVFRHGHDPGKTGKIENGHQSLDVLFVLATAGKRILPPPHTHTLTLKVCV